MRIYYQATHLGRIIDWCRHQESKLWTRLEQAQTQIPLGSAIWCREHLPPSLKKHPTIGTTISVGSQACFTHSLSTTKSPLFPIIGNPQFPPGMDPPIRKRLSTVNCTRAQHFLINGSWALIETFTDGTGPFKLSFWTAIQLRHFLMSIPNPQRFNNPLTTFEELCATEDTLPKVLSLMYSLLISPAEDMTLNFISKWEKDLDRTFTSAQVQRIIMFTSKSSICTKMQETNYKLLTRWYLTQHALHIRYPETSEICWRCLRHRGTILHVFWSCPKLTFFWAKIREIIQKFTEYRIPNDLAFFLLHVSTMSAKLYKTSIVHHLLNAAKACIPLYWKSQTPPTIANWIQRVEDISRLEDLVLSARHQQEKYDKTLAMWKHFILSPEGIALRDSW